MRFACTEFDTVSKEGLDIKKFHFIRSRVLFLSISIVLLAVAGCSAGSASPQPTFTAVPTLTSMGVDGTPTVSPSDTPAPEPTQTQTSPSRTSEAVEPAVTLAPTSGPPGTVLAVSAAGFPPETTVQVGAGVVNTEFGVTEEVRTDAAGRVSTQLTVPDFAQPGENWVVVVRVVEMGGAPTASNPFQVTQPEGALFKETEIYLIAVGDSGQSGRKIGCGDSVVPVTVQIEPTIAPLTSALQKLFAIDSQTYGQSGLYNALYQSDLTVEGIDIEAGVAEIRLSGMVQMGGTCDVPRFKAQIRETALQYATVDEVSVFINGRPLGELS